MENIEVNKDFILRAHKSACTEWKREIEKELPELFKDMYSDLKTYVLVVDGCIYVLMKIYGESLYSWMGFDSQFTNWSGSHPSGQHALDRVENDGSLHAFTDKKLYKQFIKNNL